MQVLCGQCGWELQIDEGKAGGLVPCPRCGHEILVRDLSQDAAAADAADEGQGFAEQAKAAMERKIRVYCGKCGKGLSVGLRMAGRQAKCPACQTNIEIPACEEEKNVLENLRLRGLETPAEDTVAFEPQGPLESESGQELSVSEPSSVREAEAEAEAEQPAQEPAAQAGETAEPGKTADADESAEAEADAAKRPGRRRDKLVLVGIGVVAVLAVVGMVAVMSHKQGEAVNVAGGGAVLTASRPTAGPGATAVPESKPVVVVASAPSDVPQPEAGSGPATQSVLPPVAVSEQRACAIEVTGIQTDWLDVDGYYPARPSFIYWRVSVSMQMRSGQAKFKSYGKDVALVLDDGKSEFASLGVQAAGSVLPARPRQIELSVKSEAKASSFTFVFEVPESVTAAKLVFRDLDEVELTAPPHAHRSERIAGVYGEVQPRSLKPAVKDPVIEAIQNEPRGSIVVSVVGKDSVRVVMPQSRVVGMIKRVGDDLYQGKLFLDGQASLDCQLRVIGDNRVILYLSDKPFHHIVYQRR